MLILAMKDFQQFGSIENRNRPGNMVDGEKLKTAFMQLGFDCSFDTSGNMTKSDAIEALERFVESLDVDSDMAGVSVVTHGDFTKSGQMIEFSCGAVISLGTE